MVRNKDSGNAVSGISLLTLPTSDKHFSPYMDSYSFKSFHCILYIGDTCILERMGMFLGDSDATEELVFFRPS